MSTTKVDNILEWIKNNRILSVLLVAALGIMAFSQFFTSVKELKSNIIVEAKSTETPSYIETFDGKDLDPLWHPFTDESWTGYLAKGNYILENKDNPSGVWYLHLTLENGKMNFNEKDMPSVVVSTEVKLDQCSGDPIYGAGLLYRFDTSAKTYYAFIVNSDKQYSLYYRHARGFETLYSGRSDLIDTSRFNKIGISGDDHNLYLSINDQMVATIEENNLLEGATGVVAIGNGKFIFDNLSLKKGN